MAHTATVLPALRVLVLALLLAAAAAGCGPTKFEATSNIPAPLIDRIPVVVGVHIPKEFSEKVYHEKRAGGEYSISLGKAQSEGFLHMTQAMFTRVVVLEAPQVPAQSDPEIRGVLVPALEDYAFVTPADSGHGSYAVTLKYSVSLYSPRGELTDSWSFTGYGSQPDGNMPGSGDTALKAATALAMRDAAAKLVAEFREQAIARDLTAPGAAPVAAEVVPPVP